MSTTRIIGIAMTVIGLGLLYWGYQLSQGLTEQLTQSVSGSASDSVMLRYIGGAASTIVGVFLALRK